MMRHYAPKEAELVNELSMHPPSALSEIETWIFDLDNTLYPASCRLFEQVQSRMNDFIAELLGVDLEEAKRLRSRYFREHGTTLRGLMTVHGIEPMRFLDH